MRYGSGTEGCWNKSLKRCWTDSVKFGERFFMKEAKYLEEQKRQVEQKTREWQGPRASKNERRRSTKPKSIAQFIRQAGQDE